jgi:homoserine kinase type II
MKLSKEEVEKICKEYSLGKLKFFKPLKGGLDNFNYEVKTSKGNFIIRILREDKDKRQEFLLLAELNKGFTYSVPKPLETKNGLKKSEINGKSFWVYEKLNGSSLRKEPNFPQMKEIAIALALYHKRVQNLKKSKCHLDKYYTGIKKEFDKLEGLDPKNKEDKFALENRYLFKKIIDKFCKHAYSEHLLINHSDFDASNVLFEKDKITGIIDFDYVETGPRIRDVAISIKDSCAPKGKLNKRWFDSFLKEYEAVNPLTRGEKSKIIEFVLLENASFFIWAYGQMEKEKRKRLKYMKEVVKLTNSVEGFE